MVLVYQTLLYTILMRRSRSSLFALPIATPSLPDPFGAVACLAPTRAHPPHTATPCHYMSPSPPPRASAQYAVVWGRGGHPTCSGTGRLGGRGGPLWVPGRLLPYS